MVCGSIIRSLGLLGVIGRSIIDLLNLFDHTLIVPGFRSANSIDIFTTFSKYLAPLRPTTCTGGSSGENPLKTVTS